MKIEKREKNYNKKLLLNMEVRLEIRNNGIKDIMNLEISLE